ncbi:MAG: hypothetical protein EOP87_00200 [Verrucomicrobiaceae bacterium]|nr:MAG: hypothetical protein EOP87_00200 [Verrucomicrobiaceae bacterium]
MSVLAQHFELPLQHRGEFIVGNSIIAAALAAVGVGGKAQETEHRKKGDLDWKYFCLRVSKTSVSFPDLNSVDLVRQLRAGEIDRNGIWPEYLKLFMAAWAACETRKTFIHAAKTPGLNVADLQMIRLNEGLCSLEDPQQGNVCDLRKVFSQSALPIARIRSRILGWSMITVGFAPTLFEDDGFTMSAGSLTFPGLTFDLCLDAYQKIKAYNDSITYGGSIIPSPPDIDLPGAPPGKHPFQFALQGLLNYAQLMDWIKPSTPKTLAFHSSRSPGRMGIIDENASSADIEAAITHSKA